MRLKNIKKLMHQASQMQKSMHLTTKKLASQTFTGKSPQNLVTVTFTGDDKMKNVKMNPKVIDKNDPDTLSDLIVSATNDALGKMKKTVASNLKKFK